MSVAGQTGADGDGGCGGYPNDLEQILRCAVCLDRINDPRILPCQHTFCASPCLEGLIDSTSRVLRCPECRERYLAPAGGVRQLPSNRVIANLLELATATAADEEVDISPRDSTTKRCRACRRDDVQAFALCLHCNRQICSECKAVHLRQLRLDVSFLVGRVRRQLPGMADKIAELNSNSSTVRANVDKLKAEIGGLFERLASSLRARESALLEELKLYEEDQFRKWRVQRAEYDSALARSAEFCDSLEERLRNAAEPTEIDVVSYHRQCIDQLKHLEHFDRQSDDLRPPTLRFSRSRCLDLVETCDVGVLMPSAADAGAPAAETLRTDTGTSEVRRYDADRTRAGLTSSDPLPPAPIALAVPLADNRPSARNPYDQADLLRLMSSAVQQSRPEISAASPFETVRRAFADYMRAVRPFVSPSPAEAYPGDTLPFPTTEGSGSHPAIYGRREYERTVAGEENEYSGRMFADLEAESATETSYRTDRAAGVSASEVSPVAEGLTGSNAEMRDAARSRGLQSAPLEATERRSHLQTERDSSPLIDYHRKIMPAFKIGNRGTESGALTWPRGVAASPVNDTIVVADSGNQRVQVFDRQGRFVHSFGSYGQGEGQFDTPTGVAATASGYIVVSDRYNHRLLVFDAYGDYVRRIGAEGADFGQLSQPWGLACDGQDHVYVCDKGNHRVQVFGVGGECVRSFGRCGEGDGEFNGPYYLCVSADRKVIVSDSGNNRIQVFTTSGEFLVSFGSEGSAAGQLRRPRGVAVDSQGYVVVADSGNNRVQVFRQDGSLHWVFGTWGQSDGNMKGVEGVALNSCGQIVVVDRDNHRVQVF